LCESAFLSKSSLRAEEAFDAEAFIPLDHALAAAERADFELTGIGGHGEVGDKKGLVPLFHGS